MQSLQVVLLAALLVEALVQVVKGWLTLGPTVSSWVWPTLSTLLGVAVCLLAKVDALAEAGLSLGSPVVAQVVTGILISRGASFVHDLWGRVATAG
jgi:hypothetical protein